MSPPAPLAADDVHLWLLELDCPRDVEDASLLTPDEQTRAARFHDPIHRRRFLARRAWLRRVLGLYLDLPAAAVRLDTVGNGKPALAEPAGLEFNLSHAGTLALLGVSTVPLGVDIEARRDAAAPLALAERRFAPGESEWLRAAAPADLLPRFFTCWTRKEAFIKATGEGLARGLASFDVHPAQTGPVRVTEHRGDGSPWYVLDLRPRPQVFAALCTRLARPRLSWPVPPWGHGGTPRQAKNR